jgi:hypothetical protein
MVRGGGTGGGDHTTMPERMRQAMQRIRHHSPSLPSIVMAGLDPAIQVFGRGTFSWMTGSSPVMTL